MKISFRGAFQVDAKNDSLVLKYKNGVNIKIPIELLKQNEKDDKK